MSLESLLSFIQTLASFLVALLVLVTVHEFGHFYVARRCGVKVLRFSIGFGRVLWRRYDSQGTEYAFAALPLGGYVKMLDEREAPVAPEERHLTFNQKNVWQRIAIVAAGPIANIILAVLLFWVLLVPGYKDMIPVIDSVEPGSVAAAAGLETGQEILAIDGKPTPTWQALNQVLLARLGETGPISFRVAYRDSHFQYDSETQLQDWLKGATAPDPVAGLGITLYLPKIPPIVGEVLSDSPAQLAGFQAGDSIQSVDGQVIDDWQAWVSYVRLHPGVPLQVQVLRAGEPLAISLIPGSVDERGKKIGRVGMGVQPYTMPDELIRQYEYGVGGAFIAGVSKTWDTAGFVLLSIKKLILGEISTKNLSGPITIAKVAGSSAESGLKTFVGFLALLSVFLAVFNLLPIPVLDGGHLFYYFIEVIKGKPVSERVQMLGYQLGLFVVISLTLLALYNDITQLG
ncbi:sigma E protease regulator RseP [Cellvibrio japonicus]|uniref:Zinc metalloprotease n=1 Tax=Cellvibrio japonicus (strain Ueda107) TaxID=498211 RepID=B3PBQ5_CELJU|nr:sigma E protease regulator RseP [Cellvibrio japonicus]ACE83042.1 putative membrane-associated zinc metalloprotease [Cellvibrio japonicus Ueda107]QEI11727.1 sigma E protease regulator RseP [Cellvibrio japonicus]QEI15301.1 sigma E protease regulator RseP [Cellvibrio japonicus]QEI18881.1 sigma E protease regulator RseP [Cellvibrio japonicus]